MFRDFCDIAYRKAGIRLGQGKQALVEGRVARRLRRLGLSDERRYLELLQTEASGEELVQFLDAISTNFTSFFREAEHFGILADHLDAWSRTGQRRFRIWSAACSTGEEPYSIALTALDALETAGEVDLWILATDISTKVLCQAARGVYSAERVEPVSPAQRARYFIRQDGGADGSKQLAVKPQVKRSIVFRRLNLSTPPFPMRGPLDAIFCRNVLMYFDAPVRQRLIATMIRLLRPDGLLMIGHAETLNGLSVGLAVERPSVYRPCEAA